MAENEEPEGDAPSEFDKARLLHTDVVMHNRVELLLVGQGVMIAAMVTAWPYDVIIAVVVAVMGVVLAVEQRYALERIRGAFDFQADRVAQVESGYRGQRKLGASGPSSLRRFSRNLPFLFIAFWGLVAIWRFVVWWWPDMRVFFT